MSEENRSNVVVPAARVGRPRQRGRRVAPDVPVRVEIRIPASVAVRLYSQANQIGQPVSRLAAELIDLALDHTGGDDVP